MRRSDDKDTEDKLNRMLKETNEIDAMKLIWGWIKAGNITFMEFMVISKLYYAKWGNKS